MLNRNLHETHLRRLLAGIFGDKVLNTQLAFKGGTCLFMFYELDRFSTDLDFNCLCDNIDTERLVKLFQDYQIQEQTNKHNTWFWLLSYGKNTVKIKIEISKRSYPDNYELKDLLGLKIPIMTQDCMFAHKLCAITDRKIMQNRDLYDTLWMLKKDYTINDKIIQIRTGKSTKEYLEYLLTWIPKKAKGRKILDGLGEVLTDKQKIFYRENLLPNLIFEIKNRIIGL